jgi:hypothetical protein
MHYRIYFIACLSMLFLAGCNSRNKEKTEILHEGSFTVKARFVDGKREGKTEIYKNSGKLAGTVNYKNDLMWGMTIHYFPNGVVSDSVEYVCDKPQGYWRHYNEDGSPRHFNYYYFGLEFGPDLWYDNRDSVMRTYYFLDFERQPIVECSYDRHGNLDSVKKIDLNFVLEDREKDSVPMIRVFAFLPKIPLAEQSYSIGIAENNKPIGIEVKGKKAEKLFNITTPNFYIDTLIAAPPSGYHYYLACDLRANEGHYERSITIEAVKK